MKPLTLGAGHSNEPVKNGCEAIYETFHISLHIIIIITIFFAVQFKEVTPQHFFITCKEIDYEASYRSLAGR